MDHAAAIALARLGIAVQRAAWAPTRRIIFAAGAGNARAVCLLLEGTTERVLRAADLTAADRSALDWRRA